MKKSIIIDFDNTIGYFSQIIYLINIIEKTHHRKMTQNDINNLLKIYSYSFRPKIFEILKFIQELKKKNIIQNLILYTKNRNEIFVNMVVNFIEESISHEKDKIFENIIFSKTKTKYIDPILNLNTIYNDIESYICFVDNKKYDYETKYTKMKIFFIECDTYKYYYTNEEIIQKMNYKIYKKLNKKIINKYFKYIYKKKVNIENIPLKIHEFNSLYIFNLLNNFCLFSK